MLRVIELFAGIGGVTGGFLDAGGFLPVFLNDADPIARKTFVQNFPEYESFYRVGNVKELTGVDISKLTQDSIDGVLGCPPCQGFSAAGLRKENDERNLLLHEFGRLVRELTPKFFLLENVPSLLGAALYQEFELSFAGEYILTSKVLNAAEYGVPQLRRRAVVLGIRSDLGVLPSLPEPTHGGCGSVFDYTRGEDVDITTRYARRILQFSSQLTGEEPIVTLSDALSDLPEAPQRDQDLAEYAMPATTTYQRLMRSDDGIFVRNHRPWSHGPAMVERIASVAAGDAPLAFGTRGRNTRYFSQAYARLHPRGIARTITTNFHNPGSGRFTHYAAPRTLTLREALRIQSFPDAFCFDLTKITASQAERLIGNAFPRLLARVIARHIAALLA